MRKQAVANIKDKSPLISVYIPTHNRRVKLERAINSVLNQTYKNFEIIVCDDGSTDETKVFVLDLIKSHINIHYVHNDKPAGACSARNLGISYAKGEFITGLDDDDEFTSDRLQYLLSSWNDKYSFVCSNFLEKYSDGQAVKFYKTKKNVYTLRDLLLNNVASNQIFTKTDRLRSINGFDVRVKRLQDWDTWIKLCCKYGDFYRLDNPLYIMNNDHLPTEKRVSNNISLDLAIQELISRNKLLYRDADYKAMQRTVKFLRGDYSFFDSLLDVQHRKNIKPILNYFFKVEK